MVRHKFIRVYSSCCRRQKGKPASCAGCDYCGREPALPAFSTDAHPPRMRLCCLVFFSSLFLSPVYSVSHSLYAYLPRCVFSCVERCFATMSYFSSLVVTAEGGEAIVLRCCLVAKSGSPFRAGASSGRQHVSDL